MDSIFAVRQSIETHEKNLEGIVFCYCRFRKSLRLCSQRSVLQGIEKKRHHGTRIDSGDGDVYGT